jgi:hypothetical protein
LNVLNVSNVRQIEVHMAWSLVPGPSHLEVEIAIAKLKKYKSPGSDQIPAELIQAGGKMLLSAIHKLLNSIWNKELPNLWKESIIVPVHKKGDKSECNNYYGISMLSTSYKILSDILLLRLSPYIYIYIYIYMKLLGIIMLGFDVTDRLLIRFLALIR